MHDRLGISNSELKLPDEIRIKTLEEIRLEKANKSQMQSTGVGITKVLTNASISFKKINKPASGSGVKTFSEVLHEKKRFLETKMVPQQDCIGTEKAEGPSDTGVIKLSPQGGEIRVKTLEEIRKEKATRMQAKSLDTTNDKAPNSTDAVPKRRILCIGKTGCKFITFVFNQFSIWIIKGSVIKIFLFYLQQLSASDLKKCKILKIWIASKRQDLVALVL